ncbi:MAG: aldo/keto reductase family protein [Anaerolineae bacterium]|nr:aldo/keto reductase family protein [Anaerolineae bacterium]MDW8171300.1 aldo/keto reductase family protein [Anaerolineae bacterium]
MQYRRLGDAGMRVSAVSFGGWINWGEGKLAEDEARRIVLRAYELGVNFFDLADIYGRGKAEEQMGQTLRQFPRHTLVISTKVYWPMSDDVNDRGLSRKHIFESIHRSLKRLGTDYVDIYFCHRPDPETPLLETARTMHDLVTQGKVLYWGTSEWSGAQIQAVLDICDKHNLVRPQTEQPQYSMLVRDVVEHDVIPVAQPNGIGLVVWSPLAQGMLTGKYDDGIPAEGTRFSRETWLKDRYFTEANMHKVKRLKPLADELGFTRGQLALAWCLRQSSVSSVITGATKVGQLEENVKAADIKLSDDVIAQVENILSA